MNCNRKYFYYPENMNGLLLNIYYSLIIVGNVYDINNVITISDMNTLIRG